MPMEMLAVGLPMYVHCNAPPGYLRSLVLMPGEKDLQNSMSLNCMQMYETSQQLHYGVEA